MREYGHQGSFAYLKSFACSVEDREREKRLLLEIREFHCVLRRRLKVQNNKAEPFSRWTVLIHPAALEKIKIVWISTRSDIYVYSACFSTC